jgi:predicted transcriptional regulator with HTH domain
MRATFDGIEIEGTPDEIAKFVTSIRSVRLGYLARPSVEGEGEAPSPDEDDAEVGITEQFAYRTLRRLPLSKFQKDLLISLKDAHPGWKLSSELQEALNCSPTQLGGIFGGLGRRVTATKGYKTGYGLWEWKWDDDEGEYAYRLPDGTMKALAKVIL